MTVTIEPFRFPNGLVVSRLFREGSQVPLFAVREFDTKVLRVSAYKYTKKADGSDSKFLVILFILPINPFVVLSLLACSVISGGESRAIVM